MYETLAFIYITVLYKFLLLVRMNYSYSHCFVYKYAVKIMVGHIYYQLLIPTDYILFHIYMQCYDYHMNAILAHALIRKKTLPVLKLLELSVCLYSSSKGLQQNSSLYSNINTHTCKDSCMKMCFCMVHISIYSLTYNTL